MVTRLADGCGFLVWSDIVPGKMQTYLKRWRDDGPPDDRSVVDGKKKGQAWSDKRSTQQWLLGGVQKLLQMDGGQRTGRRIASTNIEEAQ